ncbi:hypothetical protein ACIPSE_10760 [Streptomyces sp. NPDC090106]|uniref:hypothetical protein n=1 Tax=Streptomyces sp. NPDC090106 TaxID=3365946 RepID=UPI00380D1653
MTASPPQEGDVRYIGPVPEVYLRGKWRVMGDEGLTPAPDDGSGPAFKGHDDDSDG